MTPLDGRRGKIVPVILAVRKKDTDDSLWFGAIGSFHTRHVLAATGSMVLSVKNAQKSLRLHSARPKGRGGRRTLPYAFTEQLRDTPNELLSVWGIGAANLARSKGAPVSAAPPLIPADLLI